MELKFTILFCLLCTSLLSQTSDTTWDSLYTSPYEEVLHDVKWLPNGNRIIAVGEAQTKENKLQGVFYCIDAVSGKVLKRQYFGGLRNDALLSAAEASNGTIVLVGYTESSNSKNGKDGWILQLDENFDVINNVSGQLAGPGDDELSQIIWDKKNNRGIILGVRKSNPAGDLWLISVHTRKTLIIDQNYSAGEGLASNVMGLEISREGQIWAYGNTRNSDKSNKGDLWYMQIDNNALICKIKTIPTRFPETVISGYVSPENILLLSGCVEKFGSQYAWATKIDPLFETPIDITLEKDHLGDETILAISSDILSRIYAIARKPEGTYLLDLDKDLSELGQMEITPNGKLEGIRLRRIYSNYFICAGTDQSGKRPGIRLIKTIFKQGFAIKKGLELQCINPRLESNDGNEMLTSGEYGSISFSVQNNGDDFFPGGKFTVTQEDPEVKGITVTSGADGYLEYIAGKSTSAPLTIGVKATGRVEQGQINLFFNVEGSGVTCKLPIQIGEQKAGTSYTYNSPIITDAKTREVPLTEKNVELKVVIRTNNPNLKKEHLKIKLDDLEVSNNKSGDKLEGGHFENGQYEFRFEYFLRNIPEGRHKLYIYSEEDNTSSDPIYVVNNGIRPNLHIVSIGPSYENLTYTVKDARDIAKALYKEKDTGYFANVFLDTLTGQQATANNINRLLAKLANRAGEIYNGMDKIKKNDYLIFFYSGHGMKVGDRFCLQPADYDRSMELATVVDYKEIIHKYFENIGCKVIILIDACLSGAASKSGNGTELGELIIRANETAPGIASISSCSENELSYEYNIPNGKGNGVFTKALLEAFNFEKTKMLDGSSLTVDYDLDVDNGSNKRVITIGSLEDFLKQRVPDIQAHQVGKGVMTQNPKITIYDLPKTLPIYISNN